MKTEAQRIAIAMLMGAKWAFIESGYTWLTMRECAPGFVPVDAPADPAKVVISDSIPDYLGSLDAIAQAEESCLNTPEQWRQYVLNIAKTIAGDHRPRAAGNKLKVDTPVMISAASHIRAEALLRTLSLWKP